MQSNVEYKFNVSLSVDNYINKEISGAMIGSTKEERNRLIRKQYGYNANKGIGYIAKEVTASELLDSLINGYVFCHLFNPETVRKDGAFNSAQKKDDNFKGSYCVGVDIDETNYSSIAEYIDSLEYKPTFYYSSYSNTPEKPKFRMVYVFDEIITNKYFFRYVAWTLNKKLEQDTREVITDDCNLRCSQYFNGTNINNESLNVEFGITNYIYSFNDFNINDSDYLLFLKNDCYYKSKNKVRNKEIKELINNISISIDNVSTTYYNDLQKCATPIIDEKVAIKSEFSGEGDKTVLSPDLISDMSRLDYDEFMKYNRHKYNYFYRKEDYNWIECNGFKWAYIDSNYFSLYWNVNIVKDGSKRRKKVFERMCLRRLINNEVDADTLAFNAYEDIHRFFDNSDNVLNVDYIQRNIESCFELSLEDIAEMYSDNIGYLKSRKPKNGKIYKFYSSDISFRNSSIKDINKQEIMGYYNVDMTIKENIEYLNNWGIKVSEKTLYTYLNEMGLSNKDVINRDKDNKEEYIKSLINETNCSVRKFRNTLNELNIKLSDKKLREYIKEYKEGLEVKDNTTTYYSDLQKTATPEFEDNDYIKSEFLSNGINLFNDTVSTTYYNELQFCGQSISSNNDSYSLNYQEIEKEGLRLFNQYYTNYNYY